MHNQAIRCRDDLVLEGVLALMAIVYNALMEDWPADGADSAVNKTPYIKIHRGPTSYSTAVAVSPLSREVRIGERVREDMLPSLPNLLQHRIADGRQRRLQSPNSSTKSPSRLGKDRRRSTTNIPNSPDHRVLHGGVISGGILMMA